jgi:iron-sulfur cluster assembly protein
MALDELKENDTIFTEQGINLAIDKDLLEKVKPVLLDYVEAGGLSGFLLTSSLSKEDGADNSFDFINTISTFSVGGRS